jgi:hypothetical protein
LPTNPFFLHAHRPRNRHPTPKPNLHRSLPIGSTPQRPPLPLPPPPRIASTNPHVTSTASPPPSKPRRRRPPMSHDARATATDTTPDASAAGHGLLCAPARARAPGARGRVRPTRASAPRIHPRIHAAAASPPTPAVAGSLATGP